MTIKRKNNSSKKIHFDVCSGTDAAKNLLNRKIVFFLLLIAGVMAAYIDAIDAPFVLDDPRVVERTLKLRDISGFLDFREAFSARPLVNFSFAVNYWVGGLDVKVYHATNIAIHIAAAILVFSLTRQIFSLARKTDPAGEKFLSAGRLAPYFAAALFALHPIQSQAVIYISQRAALMACFFYLLSVICYIQARRLHQKKQRDVKSWLFFALCTLFAIMAFLSKKNAAGLPLMILMVEFMFFTDFQAGWWKKLLVVLGLTALILLCFMWFAGTFKGDLSSLLQRMDRLTRETTDVSRWQYLITQFTVILLYICLIIFPKGLNIDHGYPMKTEFFQDFTPYAFLILLCILILSLVNARKYKILSFGILWFFIALSVESSILPIRDAMFEHRVYLAFPGICMIFAYLVIRIAPQKENTQIWIACVIFLACAVTVFARAQIWESELLLWRDAATKAPYNARAWNNYGDALLKTGKQEAAFIAFKNGIAASPSYAWPYCNLGKLYVKKGDLQKAKTLFLKSIERNPQFAEAHNNLAVVYMKQNKIEKGIQHFEKSILFDYEQPSTHYNLGKAYLETNKLDKAIEHLMLAISMKPGIQHRADYLLGSAWAMQGEAEKAAKCVHRAQQKGLDKAVEFVEKDPRFRSCRAAVLEKLNEF